MTLADLDIGTVRFRTSAEVLDELRHACESNPDLATFEIIGESEEGRPIAGVTLGYGPRLVTLMAGAHADEPVGPETLRHLVVEGLAARDWGAEAGGLADLFERFTLRIIPHINPDGEARNQPWISRWNDLADDPAALLRLFNRERLREAPGRDIEFGYPAMRAENRAATAFLFADGPSLALHASLHGMAFSEGALLLIEKDWLDAPASGTLREGFREAAHEAGFRLHDHDREGDKGFLYGGPGFWSTPEGAAMRAHFEAAGDPEMASRFHRSSMEEAIATSAAQPLCIVTELPLFYLSATYDHEAGHAGLAAAFRQRLGEDANVLVDAFGIQPVDPTLAVRFHLRTLALAMATAA
ncbi:MAG: M14 family zinc carboxypeptidase [Bacteroidota bacterium]